MMKNDITGTVGILIVDSAPETNAVLEAIIDSPDLTITKTASGKEALDCLLHHDFALIFLGIQLPDMDGFKLSQTIKNDDTTKHIPIIFISSLPKEDALLSQGYQAGAVDYLFKPLNPDVIRGKVNVFLDLYRQKQSLTQTTEELNKSIYDLDNYRKIVEHKNDELKYFSSHDELTGLMNRRVMEEILLKEFDGTNRYGSDLSCLLFDLDFFKETNDNYGHACGDYVLKEFSQLLKKNLRDIDFSFRYGGEEFLILLPQTSIGGAVKSAEKIRKVCEQHLFHDGLRSIKITVSAGIASAKHNKPKNAWDLTAFADKALYRAKAEGRNRVTIHMSDNLGLSHNEIADGKGPKYFHEKLSSVLEKTKKASLDSIELLVKDMGGEKFQDHNRRVLHYLEKIGKMLNLPPTIIKSIKRAALIHDSLKVLVENSISGSSGELNPSQKAVIEDHPYMLAELTELFNFFANEREVLLHHHENYDGSGYPQGLSGHEIPFGARLFALADAVVAMTSNRPYRKKLSNAQVIQEITDHAGTQFDPALVKLFLKQLEQDPP